MKYSKFNIILLFACISLGASCGSGYNNGNSVDEGEYEVTEAKECENCDGFGVIKTTCTVCNGTGETDSYYYEEKTSRVPCSSCHGNGGFICAHCNGTGRHNCETCSGRGVRVCDTCHGNGVVLMPSLGAVDCPLCDGVGFITCFACNGDKIVDCGYCNNGKVMCESCWGLGYFSVPTTDSGTRKKTCENCNGKKYFKNTCPDCNGQGRITVVKVYDRKTDRLIRVERK